MSYDLAAAGRVREILSGRPGVTEKKMVGGLSFNVNGAMCCGVTGTALMVRVGRDGRDWALAQPHVRPMAFAGRALSGFVCVDPEGYRSESQLATWVQRALDFTAALAAQRPVGGGVAP